MGNHEYPVTRRDRHRRGDQEQPDPDVNEAANRGGLSDPEDAIQDAPVVHRRHATRLVRQQRLDHAPLEVSEIVSGPDPFSFEELESRSR